MGKIWPPMRNRRCSNCGHEFALWCGMTFKHTTARWMTFAFKTLAAVVVMLVLVDAITAVKNPDRSVMLAIFDWIESLVKK